MTYQRSIFIFRRDLRLVDNRGLNAALKNSVEVLPIFIFDPRQCKPHPYLSSPGLIFLAQSLRELDQDIQREANSRLHLFFGVAEELIGEIARAAKAQAVYFNRDYTPFSAARDQEIKARCDQEQIAVHRYADALLNEPEESLKGDGTPYTVFTPFFKRCSQNPVRSVVKLESKNFCRYTPANTTQPPPITIDEVIPNSQTSSHYPGGRSAARCLLKNIAAITNYKEDRDFPALQSTSTLSPHNKFGTISIRELHSAIVGAFGGQHQLLNELYWRDFFTHIGHHFPHVFKGCFHRKYDRLQWDDSGQDFARWCSGETGFPLVDAGMRELNQTGFMHNRVRMVVASFLTKDLHLNWRDGERYFAGKLVDYDPAVNNGNWQWAASTGCDAQPYFRIFNPWLQQERFDKECRYIKKWIPELGSLSPKEIHLLHEKPATRTSYPAPMCDHAEQKAQTQAIYEACQ